METTRFFIPNISCGHCVKAIEKELSAMDGVVSVTGDSASKEITVQWDPPATDNSIKATLKEINYPASD